MSALDPVSGVTDLRPVRRAAARSRNLEVTTLRWGTASVASGARTLAVSLTAAAMVIGGCGGAAPEDGARTTIQLAPIGQFPPEVQRAPVAVSEAYRFAVANTAILRQVPCHCGCGAMGHTSNAACYLAPGSREGAPVFDGHALGCSICVDITRDVMRLMRQGKALAEIRAYVDTTYARYGPSNLR